LINMTNFTFYVNPTLTLLCVPDSAPALFSLEATARLTGVHPDMLRYYCRLGLIDAQADGPGGEPAFDESALQEVRRIGHYRRHLGVNRRALPLICELRRESDRRQIEVHFLHCP
jgi:DNA-binding transcriptional MerR regulator